MNPLTHELCRQEPNQNLFDAHDNPEEPTEPGHYFFELNQRREGTITGARLELLSPEQFLKLSQLQVMHGVYETVMISFPFSTCSQLVFFFFCFL